MTFFPQLVAGPIVRAIDFLPQCIESKKGSIKQIGWGLSLFIIGLFNKVVIADQFMSPVVEKIFDSTLPPSFFQAWAGVISFTIQIFCDFAGYSSCAIGIALCLGFELPDNFRFPYGAKGFSDFWSRWHISLSSWLRDYLYIMLGGNRKGHIRAYFNLMVTMLLGGLWHGASWLFVIWGGLHGLFLIVERMLKRSAICRFKIWQSYIGNIFLTFITFFFVSITWVFFRAKELKHAFEILSGMFGKYSLFGSYEELALSRIDYVAPFIVMIMTLFIHYSLRNSSLEDVTNKIPWHMRSILLSVMIYLIVISFSGEDRAFIYFQF